ncbi:hypothetical protein [Labedaea rhizosphaerae]|uniref:Uncharacterized protein n=1 Tax=Labedaea rhizosphaerae TaxID=598644 RepID=A0A4V6PVU2_LABRH|nr:hypothetical protein [Labedaea rhizosphaerae]TDP97738.1 hypothetical protein EV186_103702 [Labedaea rhizosphaerae]
MDLAEAVEADQLWGWPVEVLDHLLFLQRQAWSGRLPLESWRAEDASLREGQPAVDAVAVESALTEWVASGELQLGAHGGLLGRLTVLANRPPSDDDLWVELITVAKRAGAADANPRFVEVDLARRDLIVSWLRSSDSVDAVTGLPWSVVARFGSEVDDARQAALDGVAADERSCADLVATRRAELGSSTGDEWPA